MSETTDALLPLGLRSKHGPFVSFVGIKKHQSTSDGATEQHGPAIFVAGLPLGFDERAVENTFSCFGDVEQVFLHRTKVDEWMDAFDAEEERKQKEKLAAMAGDGWTVVVRSKGRSKTKEGADGIATRSGGVAASQAAAHAALKKDKGSEFNNFYRFQKREKQRSELLDLREKFNEDRKRISELRATRNFKPY
eukprot:gene6719-3390_t